jgi:ferric-dicitrate binding protein FerR (iron transport regulator)
VNQESGVYQSSTVLISTGQVESVYRSVEQVPERLRSKLIKSTTSANSQTILIADRRGCEEIARAMRALPAPMQRKMMQAVMEGENAPRPSARRIWLRKAALALCGTILLCGVAALVWFLFSRR